METKQYLTPQFELIQHSETEKVFFQTSGGAPSVGSVGLGSVTISSETTSWD